MNLEDLYNNPEITNVLDIGCNLGSYNYANLPRWNVVCVDQIYNAEWKFPENCKFIQTNFFDYKTYDIFDFIICKYVLEHQESTAMGLEMIRGISKHLRVGGYALFVLPQGHCLSNTIYKAFFNIKLHEGLLSTKDGGHWANYDPCLLEEQFKQSGFRVVDKTLTNDLLPDFSEAYPYSLFYDCVKFYKDKGMDLTENTMTYFVIKE